MIHLLHRIMQKILTNSHIINNNFELSKAQRPFSKPLKIKQNAGQ